MRVETKIHFPLLYCELILDVSHLEVRLILSTVLELMTMLFDFVIVLDMNQFF
jgi:hypothetical protein